MVTQKAAFGTRDVGVGDETLLTFINITSSRSCRNAEYYETVNMYYWSLLSLQYLHISPWLNEKRLVDLRYPHPFLESDDVCHSRSSRDLPKVRLDKTSTLQNIECQENIILYMYIFFVLLGIVTFLNVWCNSNGNVNSLPGVVFVAGFTRLKQPIFLVAGQCSRAYHLLV